MTVLRAQAGSNVVSKAKNLSHSPNPECRKIARPRGRKTHSLYRASSQREGQLIAHSRHDVANLKQKRVSFKTSTGLVKEGQAKSKAGQESASWYPLAAAVSLPLLVAAPAWAAYTPADGEQLFKNAAGVAYILLVCFFFYRLFRKRAYTGVTQNFRSKANEALEEPEEEEVLPIQIKEATPLTALWGAAQAGVICYLLFQLCGLVDGYFDRQELPDQYTAHNITVTLRTVVRGLAYLMTFLFGANCLGLSGLAVQLAFFPEQSQSENLKQE